MPAPKKLTPEQQKTITKQDRERWPGKTDAQIFGYKKRQVDAQAKNPSRYRSKEDQKKGHQKGTVDEEPVAPETRIRKGPICGAKRRGTSRSGPGICCMPAGQGTDHPGTGACKWHGGATNVHTRAAVKQDAVMKAIQYGAPIDIDPDTAVLQELHRTAGHVHWLSEQVTGIRDGMLFEQTPFGLKPNQILAQYQEERRHLTKVAEVAKRMGIQERQIRLAEAEGQLIAMVLQGFMNDPDLALTPQQKILGRDLMRKHLLAIETQAIEVAQ